MKALVIGCGNMGQRNTKNLLELGHEVAVWDQSPDQVRVGVGLGAVSGDLKTDCDAVLVCTPPD